MVKDEANTEMTHGVEFGRNVESRENDTASTSGLSEAAEPNPHQMAELEFDQLRFSLSAAGCCCF